MSECWGQTLWVHYRGVGYGWGGSQSPQAVDVTINGQTHPLHYTSRRSAGTGTPIYPWSDGWVNEGFAYFMLPDGAVGPGANRFTFDAWSQMRIDYAYLTQRRCPQAPRHQVTTMMTTTTMMTMAESASASTAPDMPAAVRSRPAAIAAALVVVLVTLTGCWQSNIENTVDFVNSSGVELTFRTETGSHETTVPGGGSTGVFILPEGTCLDEEVLAIDREGRVRARQDGLCGGDQWSILDYELEPPGPRFDDPEAETG